MRIWVPFSWTQSTLKLSLGAIWNFSKEKGSTELVTLIVYLKVSYNSYITQITIKQVFISLPYVHAYKLLTNLKLTPVYIQNCYCAVL